MRTFFLVLTCMALAGCLTTAKPVFDQTNSVAAGDSPTMVAFVEAWERELPNAQSPRELIENASRVHDMDGLVIVEETTGDSADYYAVGMLGPRPMLCLLHDDKMETVAARHGVSLKIERTEEMDEATPAPMTADGTKEALHAFVLDAFRGAGLVCQAASELVGGP